VVKAKTVKIKVKKRILSLRLTIGIRMKICKGLFWHIAC